MRVYLKFKYFYKEKLLKLQRFSLGKAENIKVKSLVDGYFPTLRVLT